MSKIPRVSLPEAGEGVFRFNPSSPEQVIEARFRREESWAEHIRKTRTASPERFKRGPLGLSEIEITMIRHEAVERFLASAKLPEELRQRRARCREMYEQRIERYLKMAEAQRVIEFSREAEIHAVSFARGCEKAIERATGEFADMLMQAMIARRGRKEFSLALGYRLWRECLEFAMSLTREPAGRWCDVAYGNDPREAHLPHLHRLEIDERQSEQNKFFESFAGTFRERLRHGAPGWLDEADRRIKLRYLLSYAPGEAGMPSDESKQAIVMLLTASPALSARNVCAKLDSMNDRNPGRAPVPKAWGTRSWIDAYTKRQNAVEVYISKVRRQARIPLAKKRR
jgi:hypothetical protein